MQISPLFGPSNNVLSGQFMLEVLVEAPPFAAVTVELVRKASCAPAVASIWHSSGQAPPAPFTKGQEADGVPITLRSVREKADAGAQLSTATCHTLHGSAPLTGSSSFNRAHSASWRPPSTATRALCGNLRRRARPSTLPSASSS